MSWADFVHNFDELYVCRFYDQLTFPCQGRMEGRWDSSTAGGCCNHPSVERNVQLAISCIDDGPQQTAAAADTELVIELIQADSRGSGTELPIVILELYDNDGQPVTQHKRGRLIANRGNNTLAVHIQLTLSRQQAQRSIAAPLTLLPCTYRPDTLTSFTLRWFASSTVHVQRYGGAPQTANSVNTAHSPPTDSGTAQQQQQQQPSQAAAAAASSEAGSLPGSDATPVPSECRSLAQTEAEDGRASFTIAASQPPSPVAQPAKNDGSSRPRLPLVRRNKNNKKEQQQQQQQTEVRSKPARPTQRKVAKKPAVLQTQQIAFEL